MEGGGKNSEQSSPLAIGPNNGPDRAAGSRGGDKDAHLHWTEAKGPLKSYLLLLLLSVRFRLLLYCEAGGGGGQRVTCATSFV